MKTCRDCGKDKPLSEFYADKRRKDGRGIYCKTCWAIRYSSTDEQKHRARLATKRHWDKKSADPEFKAARRRNQLKYLYGLTEKQYDAMLANQDGKCAICKKEMPVAHVDHDHSCCSGNKSCGKCVRGLLCPKCNTALGLFNENVEALENALRYVRSGSHP